VKSVVDRLVGALLALLMGASVVAVLWQVASRYLLGDPSAFTDELVRYLLIWIGLVGAAYAFGQRQHLAIDLLPQRLDGRGRRRLEAAVEGVVLAFAAVVLVAGGLRLVLLTLALGQRSPALGLPLGWVYLALPVSGLLTLVYGGLRLSGRGAGRPAGERSPAAAPRGER